jgi:hypothetical protein
MSDPDALLRTYLQDHHAGATAGLELARRAAGSNEETEYGDELARIAVEIETDRDALGAVMEELGVKPHSLKDAAGWTAEKVGRLKPNNSLLSYSPLSRVVELEGLLLGVTGKLSLWRALQQTRGDRVTEADLEELADRAEDQRERLEALRERAVGEAFGGAQPSAKARRASAGSA